MTLVPMAGTTDASFRQLCTDSGAGYVVTEMVSVQGLTCKSYKASQLMKLSDTERPAAIQLFGNEPDYLARGAEIAINFFPDAIDINMGCPASKVCGTSGQDHGSGSALMKDPELYGKIVTAVKTTVDVPVTVKIRKGWDKNSVNAVEMAQICEATGADAIAVHGKTHERMYQPNTDWEIITAVEQAMEIPMIGNGDVADAKSAAKILEQTGCDMVMVSRATLGNPWIFREIHAYLTTGALLPPPTLNERPLMMLRHVYTMCEDRRENHVVREAHKHAGWCLKGPPNVTSFRREARRLTVLHDTELLAQRILSSAVDGASHGTVM